MTSLTAPGAAPRPGTVDPAALPLFKRVALRYLPLLFLLYVVAIIDRVNVGFASCRCSRRFSSPTWSTAWAPASSSSATSCSRSRRTCCSRVGARRWIARILILWGPIAAATAFVETPLQFYVLRFLLGVGEAGLFPGIVLFLTYWFPAERRTRYIAMFMLGMPIAGVIIGPLSAAIMTGMQGLAGLQGWQWMFIVQGLPALFLGFVVLAWLDDRPASAKWLSPAEKTQLQRAVGDAEFHAVPWREELKLAFTQKGLWTPTAAYFFLVAAASSFGLWGPQFLQDVLKTDLRGIGAALGGIFLVGTIAMAGFGAAADKGGRRESILVALLAFGSVGFFAAAATAATPLLAVLAFGVGVTAYLASFPVFWGSMTPRLAPAAAAAAIALVNSVGNLGGAIGPAVIGPIKQNIGLVPSIASLGVMMGLAAVFALALRRR